MKKVLVLLSSYNGEKYLEEQLDSIRQQQDVDISLLIRDDGSKDNTVELINGYTAKFYEFKLELIRGENIGFALSFSKLLEIVYKKHQQGITFDYYAFSDQDDVWLPSKTIMAVKMLGENINNSKPICYCSNTIQVDKNCNILANNLNIVKFSKASSLVQNIATGCTMLFNYQALRIYAENTHPEIKFHDFYMFLLCSFFGAVIHDRNSYIYYRQHDNNQVGRLNFWQRWIKRISSLGKNREPFLDVQSKIFLSIFESKLSTDDIKLISKVAFYNDNIYNKLSLLYNYEIRQNKFETDFFYRLKILIGCI